jgi:hypothetical protein
MGIDAIIALAGLVFPPVVDFVKKKFLKPESETVESTMSTLATTKADVLPSYVTAVTGYLQAQIQFFNRDISGVPSQWVVNMRAAIRPIGTVFAFLILAGMVIASFNGWKFDPSVKPMLDGIRLSSEFIITSWFGSRISISS